MKKGVVVVLLMLLIPSVLGATIHGVVYDLDLEQIPEVIITVNTIPEQTYVSKDGAYSFTLPPGNYTLRAHVLDNEELRVEEEIHIQDEGDYYVDLIVLPDTSPEEEILDEDVTVEGIDEETQTTSYWIPTLLGIAVIAGIIAVVISARRMPKRKTALDHDLAEQILALLKDQQGRTTQKEMRKHFPVSEAKISLVLSELEAKGKIDKIKKGKGNIIVLKT